MTEPAKYIIGIDASRCRSGGAYAHIKGILNYLDIYMFGIKEVHIWSHRKLLDMLPNKPWLVKHSPNTLNGSLIEQVYWQTIKLTKELKTNNCKVLFTADASTLCRFKPNVVLSQDMLSYEPGIMQKYKLGKKRFRLLLILWIQNAAFRRSAGAVFLTNYAARVIQQSCGRLMNTKIIPHGFDTKFIKSNSFQNTKLISKSIIHCLYVSPISLYKHQWMVVRAIVSLRDKGFSIQLNLVGGDDYTAHEELLNQLRISDPDGKFVILCGQVCQNDLPEYLNKADIFIFASSCENMPVTLLEAMAAGLPIACSDRGPMPEILKDAGLYFNPENDRSISQAIEKLILDDELRINISKQANLLAMEYSWKRCADETFSFIVDSLIKYEKRLK